MPNTAEPSIHQRQVNGHVQEFATRGPDDLLYCNRLQPHAKKLLLRRKLKMDRQGVETVYKTFRQLILLTANESLNRIVVIEVENELYYTFGDDVLRMI